MLMCFYSTQMKWIDREHTHAHVHEDIQENLFFTSCSIFSLPFVPSALHLLYLPSFFLSFSTSPLLTLLLLFFLSSVSPSPFPRQPITRFKVTSSHRLLGSPSLLTYFYWLPHYSAQNTLIHTQLRLSQKQACKHSNKSKNKNQIKIMTLKIKQHCGHNLKVTQA